MIQQSLFFTAQVSEIITSIISSTEEAKTIGREKLTHEFIKQFYRNSFKNSSLHQKQLIIHNPLTDIYFEMSKLMFDMPDVTTHKHTFLVPYPAGKVIGLYFTRNPKITLFSLILSLLFLLFRCMILLVRIVLIGLSGLLLKKQPVKFQAIT